MNTVLFLIWTMFVFVLGMFVILPIYKRDLEKRERAVNALEHAMRSRERAVSDRELAVDQVCDRILVACDRLADKARAERILQ